MKKHIYFLRHFQTENNVNHILNGRSVNSSIISGDVLQCSANIEMVFCSPALRCRQTISFFLQSTIPNIVYTDLLLERSLGLLEGMSRTQAANQYPALFSNNKLIVYTTPPQGESYNDFRARAEEFWGYCNSVDYNNILICAHNQILKMLYFVIKGEAFTIDSWNSLVFPNGEIIKIK